MPRKAISYYNVGFVSSEREPVKTITSHKEGDVPITNPKHGDSGWWEGQLYIYDQKYGRTYNWITLWEYQNIKEKATRKIDHRLHNTFYYEDRAETHRMEVRGR